MLHITLNNLNVKLKITNSMKPDVFEKLTVTQLLKKFSAFYGTWRFITVLTRARHWSLCWARWIQSTPSHSISLRFILILSSHLYLGRHL